MMLDNSWNTPFLSSLMTKAPTGGSQLNEAALRSIFQSIAAEFNRMQKEINDLKGRVK